MVSADTIKTFKIKNPENDQTIDIEMSIKDYMFYKILNDIAASIRGINR